MTEVEIRGVRVSFKRRDVRLVNDAEYRVLETLVDTELRQAHGSLEAILVETDYLDPEHLRYVATTRHQERHERTTEPADRGDDQ